MKTIDDCNYKPGQTLYHTHEGNVFECATRTDATHLPDLAVGVDRGLLTIGGHYARRDNAYVAATNYWLKRMNDARENLARLTAERDGRPVAARSDHPNRVQD